MCFYYNLTWETYDLPMHKTTYNTKDNIKCYGTLIGIENIIVLIFDLGARFRFQT